MPEVMFHEPLCKGCGLCVFVCPKKIIKLDTTRVNVQGYYPAMVNNMAVCIGCAACAKMCPDSVITVRK
jgi:2-oxoglutarate ferredoxin oxidoreductase subunit delta